jgi:hypothetical protein
MQGAIGARPVNAWEVYRFSVSNYDVFATIMPLSIRARRMAVAQPDLRQTTAHAQLVRALLQALQRTDH